MSKSVGIPPGSANGNDDSAKLKVATSQENMAGRGRKASGDLEKPLSVEKAEKQLKNLLDVKALESIFQCSPTDTEISSCVNVPEVIRTFDEIRRTFAVAREQGHLEDVMDSDWIDNYFAPFISGDLWKLGKELGKEELRRGGTSAPPMIDSPRASPGTPRGSRNTEQESPRNAHYSFSDPSPSNLSPSSSSARVYGGRGAQTSFNSGNAAHNGAAKVSEKRLRVLFIMLLNPINELFPEVMLGDLAKAVNVSGNKNLQVLSEWSSTEVTPEQYYQYLIRPFVNALDRFVARRKWDESCVHLAILLNVLRRGWHMNESFRKYFHENKRSSDKRENPFHLSKLAKWKRDDFNKEYMLWQTTDVGGSQANLSLFHFPFLLDAAAKRSIIDTHNHNCVVEEARMNGTQQAMGFITIKPFSIRVRRDHIVRDTVVALAKASASDLASPLRVTFEGEEGIDAGGVRAEFFQLISAQLFGQNNPMFTRNPYTRRLWYGDSEEMKAAIESSQNPGTDTATETSTHTEENPSTTASNSEPTAPTASSKQTKAPPKKGSFWKGRKSRGKAADASSSNASSNGEATDTSLNAFIEATFNDNYEHTLMNEKSSELKEQSESVEDKEVLRFLPGYKLAGQIMGLAMYNGMRIDALFPPIFFQQMLDRKPQYNLHDLEEVDPDLARHLRQVYEMTSEAEIASLDLYFEVNGQRLKPGGETIPVDLSTKKEYISCYIKHVLFTRVQHRVKAIAEGFKCVVNVQAPAIQLLDDSDIEVMLVGAPNLDFAALRKSAKYKNGYHMDHKTIKALWNVVENRLTRREQEDFLSFTTGSPRAPVGGLGNITLQIQRYGADSEKLPTASTCFFTLHLPDYGDEEKLYRKLCQAIEYKDAFGLG